MIPSSPAVLLALALALALAGTSVFIVFSHDRKHQELDRWVAFSFSRETLRSGLSYYRFMALSMIVYYVLFTASCLLLQAEGHRLFAHGDEPSFAGPIGTSLFALDLMLRGALFDVMEHFGLGVTPLLMNRRLPWFVWYAFIFRMFYSLTLMKILFSFVWIYGKIRMARQLQRQSAAQLRLFE